MGYFLARPDVGLYIAEKYIEWGYNSVADSTGMTV